MTTQNRTARPETAVNVAGRFGTFTGVFTPNVLTILGIILFLRIGWVVGQAGLVNALSIVLIACSISFITGLSLSAIATSMKVEAGGSYYLISRSLGLEIGGAIGIPLFLSQAISVAFYIIGFTESLQTIDAIARIDFRVVATVFAFIFIFIAFVGADFALKIQYFILGALVLAIISFFSGGWNTIGSPNLASNYSEGLSFWSVFAVFFPAVTGIVVGTSLSGDLKEPSKSIPLGTISSIVITTIVYLAVVIWFSVQLPPDILISDLNSISRVARWPVLILAGVWAATLSSALGSVIAAPRTIEAIARDEITPSWMAHKMGSATEPRAAVLLTGVIAILIIWMGDLNFVAPIISMFFLNTYGMINLSAGIEKLVGNPSYRPSFQIPWYVSLLGAIGCYGAMFLISPVATIFAIIISYGFFFYLERKQIERTWGDVKSGVWFAIARYALLNLETTAFHTKNWRPNIIVFTGQPHNRQQLVELAEWLSQGRGIVTFFQLIVGDFNQLAPAGWRETARKNIQKFIKREHITAFAESEIVSDYKSGVLTVIQAHGIGGLEANSALLGWSGTSEGRADQLNLAKNLVVLAKNIFFLHYDPSRKFGLNQTINVWWKGQGGNANLMLLLAYIIKQHRTWRTANIQLLRIIDGEQGKEQTIDHMNTLLKEIRVEATPVVLVRKDNNVSWGEIIIANSETADLTLLGTNLPEENVYQYAEQFDKLVKSIGTVLMVHNAQPNLDLLST